MGFMDKLYGIAGKVGDTFEKGAKNVSDGSKKAMDKMRLNKEINQTKGEINAIYTQIGKKCFELNTENPANEYAEMVKEINEKLAKIETLNNELKALEENKVNCPNCGVSLDKGVKFCEKCGSSVETIPPVVSAVPVTDENPAAGQENSPTVESVAAEESAPKVSEVVKSDETISSEEVSDKIVEVQSDEISAFKAVSTTSDSGWQSAPDSNVQKNNDLTCQECGAEVESSQNFCQKCGAKIEK